MRCAASWRARMDGMPTHGGAIQKRAESGRREREREREARACCSARRRGKVPHGAPAIQSHRHGAVLSVFRRGVFTAVLYRARPGVASHLTSWRASTARRPRGAGRGGG